VLHGLPPPLPSSLRKAVAGAFGTSYLWMTTAVGRGKPIEGKREREEKLRGHKAP